MAIPPYLTPEAYAEGSPLENYTTRVYPFDGSLGTTVYRLEVLDAYITGSIRYLLQVGNCTAAFPDLGGGGGEPDPVPVLFLSTNSVVFDNTVVGEVSPPETFSITNLGTGDLIITEIADGSPFPFTHDALPATIAPSASLVVTGTFVPTVVGLASRNMNVVSNSTTSPDVVSALGFGLTPPDPPPPDPVVPPWELWYFSQNSVNGGNLTLALGATEENDLVYVSITWRGGDHYSAPAGWEVMYELADGFLTTGTKVSTMIAYKIHDGTPISSPTFTRPYGGAWAVGSLIVFRPRAGSPRFEGYSDQTMESAESTFVAPSLTVTEPNTLLVASAGLATFDGYAPLERPFGAVGLDAEFSTAFDFVEDGSAWGQLTYFAITPPGVVVTQLLYALTNPELGPTGQFVGTANTASRIRTVVGAFSGPPVE
jgi:hypothetical protein